MYPNPTNGIITFDFSTENIQHMKITDLTGKLVFEKSNVNQNEIVDMSSVESGIYIVTLQNEKESMNLRVVKK